MMVMIDGPMINRFIDDVENFQKCADSRFQKLDSNGDGLLSREDLSLEGEANEIDALVFYKFDVDGNGWIDGEEYRSMMMEMLIAIARGIGPMPVIVAVEEDSFLMKAYENELERIDRKLDQAIESNGIQVVRKDGKMKRKTFGLCACNSARCLGQD